MIPGTTRSPNPILNGPVPGAFGNQFHPYFRSEIKARRKRERQARKHARKVRRQRSG